MKSIYKPSKYVYYVHLHMHIHTYIHTLKNMHTCSFNETLWLNESKINSCTGKYLVFQPCLLSHPFPWESKFRSDTKEKCTIKMQFRSDKKCKCSSRLTVAPLYTQGPWGHINFCARDAHPMCKLAQEGP